MTRHSEQAGTTAPTILERVSIPLLAAAVVVTPLAMLIHADARTIIVLVVGAFLAGALVHSFHLTFVERFRHPRIDRNRNRTSYQTTADHLSRFAPRPRTQASEEPGAIIWQKGMHTGVRSRPL